MARRVTLTSPARVVRATPKAPTPKPTTMSVLTRLVDPQPGEEKIPVHQFTSGVAEYVRGAITAQQFFAAFSIAGQERTALTAWFTNEILTSNISREKVHDVLMLGEAGYYDLTKCQVELNLA